VSFNRAHAKRFDFALRKWLIGLAVLLIASLPLAYSALVVPLTPLQQAQVALAVLALAILLARSRFMRPLIIFLSAFFSMRYFYWRVNSTLNLDSALDATVSVLLLVAESYGLLVLFLGYFQTIESTERDPVAVTEFPSVDVFIPTYNEPVDVVRRTVIGALAIDYREKRVYLLDDGKRPEMEGMAQALGCEYVTRPDHKHAKAGNLNHALKVTDGEFIAVFDADHVPVSSFLKKTMGFFKDSDVALVQTAQHFFNPDPYERNLGLTGRIAPEQIFFYRVIQPGNDFWNSAFFCGSCAVLRRSALQSIGGFRTATVTEDAHTALQLHSRRLRSVYLPQALAAGLATETFAAHVRQRIRWARGMAQILRLDCPLFKRGLSLPQRLNYFNAMLHFFFGIPRLVLIAAPLTYLLFGAHPITADAVAVLAYIFPHIGLSTIANSTISKEFRHSFWSGVYEISIAPFVAGVTLLALVNPKFGKFNVTDKGTNVDHARFDLHSARFTLVLIAVSVVALVIALPIRVFLFRNNHGELDSAMLNSAWAIGNLVALIAAACVAYEQPQQRRAPRIKRDFECDLLLPERCITAQTIDISESGIRVRLPYPVGVVGHCWLKIKDKDGNEVEVRGRPAWSDWTSGRRVEAAFEFEDLRATTQHKLIEMIFCADRSWSQSTYSEDRILESFWYLLTTFWRVTKPRASTTTSSPAITGTWAAEFGGVACRCNSISGTQARVEFRSKHRPSHSGKFVIEIAGRTFEIPPGTIRTSGSLFTIQFAWTDSGEMHKFYNHIYCGGEPQVQSPGRKRLANVC